MRGSLTAIGVSLPYIKTSEFHPSIFHIGGIGDLVTFDYSRLREILVLRMRAAVQALRCRALTTGESICAVRRVKLRSASLQKPPEASCQGFQEFIGLINVGGARPNNRFSENRGY